MKTTLDLPDALVKQVKLRALREGRKLKDAVADLLRQGLASSAGTPMPRPTISIDAETGLPTIRGAPAAPISTMSAEQIYAAIQKSQEEEEDLERLGVSLRR
jgi:plasmid stability protein